MIISHVKKKDRRNLFIKREGREEILMGIGLKNIPDVSKVRILVFQSVVLIEIMQEDSVRRK